jgi:hypothetical protein
MAVTYSTRGIDLYDIESKIEDSGFNRALVGYLRNKATSNKDIADIENAIYGVINKAEYKWLMNPFNAKDKRFTRYPGDLQNVDIIMPNVRKFIGEYIKSYNTFHIVSKLPNEDNRFLDELNKFAIDLMTKKATAQIDKALSESGTANNSYNEADANININDEIDKFTVRWKDQRAIIDEEMLEYFKYITNDEYLYIKAYSFWIIFGQYFIDRYIETDDVIKEVIHPSVAYPIYNNADFVEDYDGFMIKYRYSLSQILAKFKDILTDKDKEYLKKTYDNYTTTGHRKLPVELLRTHFIEFRDTTDKIAPAKVINSYGDFDVEKIYFKGFKKIKVLTYLDIEGNEQMKEVDSDYKLEPDFGDISLTEDYLPTVYVVYSIGDPIIGVITKPTEIEVQRNLLNNNYVCKIPVTGKVNLFPGMPNHSIVLTLTYYQKTLNILYLARQRVIAKNHGKIGIFPKGLLGGTNEKEEEQIYRMTASGFFFPDDTTATFNTAVQALKQIDLSDQGYIESLSRLIIETKELANDAIDMSRQRAGQSYASDGKFTTQQAILRSSLGTAIINEIFNNSRCRDYEADIDFAKVAWMNGKKGMYVSSDRKTKFFETNGIDILEREFGLFADNSTKSNEKISKLEQLAFSAAQNGEIDVAVEAIDNENISKLKEILLKYQDAKRKNEEAIRKSNESIAKSNAEGMKAQADAKEAGENARNQLDNRTRLLIKELELATERLNKGNTADSNIGTVDRLNAEIAALKEQLNASQQ